MYSGSFTALEENGEKSEKTEKSEEVLHRIYYSNPLSRVTLSTFEQARKVNVTSGEVLDVLNTERPVISDYNVYYIYTTSYLGVHI